MIQVKLFISYTNIYKKIYFENKKVNIQTRGI